MGSEFMIRFIVLRVLIALPILLGVSVVVFLMLAMIPGNAVDAILGASATPEARAELMARMGLDEPLPVQYVVWLSNAVQGDLGLSTAQNTSALELAIDAFKNTTILAGFAALMALILGLTLGALAEYSPFAAVRKVIESVNLLFVSVPAYSLGLILIVYLAVGMKWFPVSGMPAPGTELSGYLSHLVLPGVTAALVPAGIIARVFQTALSDIRSMDFIDAYRARGIGRLETAFRAMYNCLPTVLTTSGLQVGYLLSGIVFVETVFTWPGIGLLVYQSIGHRDLVVIQSGVMVSTLAFVIINLIVDITRGLVDPRLRRLA